MSKKKKTKPIYEAREVPARGWSPARGGHSASGGKEEMPEEILDEKKNLKDIADDIIVSYETRVKVVGGIIEDTHKMMDDFKEKRETMAGELQGVLSKCESLRKKDFDRMMADIVSRQNEREKQVREMLENFRKEEEMVAEKLKKLLAKGEEVRIKDFKKLMADIRQEQEKRVKQTGESVTGQLQDMRGEVHTMLDIFKKERQSVATAWHEMLGLFHQEKSTAPYQRLKGEPQYYSKAEYGAQQVPYGADKHGTPVVDPPVPRQARDPVSTHRDIGTGGSLRGTAGQTESRRSPGRLEDEPPPEEIN